LLVLVLPLLLLCLIFSWVIVMLSPFDMPM
jgi:hypothetical protein